MGGGDIAETDALRLTRRLPSIPSSTNTLLCVDLCVYACVRGVRVDTDCKSKREVWEVKGW